jgi:hypothetical protein
MAINFAGLLGGLGAGAQQLATQREQERQFNINRQFAERQFAESQLGRQQQYELQKAQGERADAALDRQMREARNKELRDANISAIKLIDQDNLDEENFLKELRAPGLTPADIENIRARRRQRRKVVEDALNSFDKIEGYSDLFGPAVSRLQASPIAGTGELKIRPQINWKDYTSVLEQARKRISDVAPAQQRETWATQVGLLANSIGVDFEDVAGQIPEPGSLVKGITPQTTTKQRAPTANELGIYGPAPLDTAKVLREMAVGQQKGGAQGNRLLPGFKPTETLPGGATVTRAFNPATGMIDVTETEAPLKYGYSTSEKEVLQRTALELKNQETRLLMDPRVRKANEDARTARLRGDLMEKELDWVDRLNQSKIDSASRARVAKAAAAAKQGASLGVSLADRIKMYSAESLNSYRDAQTYLADAKLRQGEIGRLTAEISKLETLANAAEVKAAESADKAMANVRNASLKVAAQLREQAKALRTQLGHIEQGNVAGMRAFTGSQMGGFDPMNASVADIAARVQTGSAGVARIGQLMQTGVEGMRSGTQQVPQQGQGGVMVNLGGINLGGLLGGGGPAPGPGGGGGGWWPGGGRFNPDEVKGPDSNRVAAFQRKYPNVDPATITTYVGSHLRPDGTMEPSMERLLSQLNKQNAKPKDNKPKPEVAPKPTGSNANKATASGPQKPSESKETRPPGTYVGASRQQYTGPQYDGYPLSRAEYQSRVRSGKPLGPKLIVIEPERQIRPPSQEVRQNIERYRSQVGQGAFGYPSR